MFIHVVTAVSTMALAHVAAQSTQPQAVTAAPPNAQAAAAEELPVIVSIVGRHQSVVIQSSSKGPVYTVKGENGQVLVDKATAVDLETSHPELYRQIKGYKADAGQWWAGSWGER